MVEVRYQEVPLARELELQVDGHAGYAGNGRDIVCAGVSAITQTLLGNLLAEEKKGKSINVEYRMREPGELHIRARPEAWYWDDIRAMFRFTLQGLKMMQESYGEYIQVKEE